MMGDLDRAHRRAAAAVGELSAALVRRRASPTQLERLASDLSEASDIIKAALTQFKSQSYADPSTNQGRISDNGTPGYTQRGEHGPKDKSC